MKCIDDWGKCGLQLGLRIPVLVPVLMLLLQKVSTLSLKPIFFFPSPPNLYASWISVGP